jgi:phage shock protein A
MEFLDRMLKVAHTNVQGWLVRTQDPEVVLERILDKMQGQLLQLRQAVAQAIACQKRTERQCRQAQAQAEEWHDRAHQALQQGQEDQARQALGQRQSQLRMVKALTLQLEQETQVATKLKRDLKALDWKLADVRAKKELYGVRARSAAATREIHQLLHQLQSEAETGALQRMEARVLDLEAEATVMADLNREGLDDRFAALEGAEVDGEIDAEFAKLQRQVNVEDCNSEDC